MMEDLYDVARVLLSHTSEHSLAESLIPSSLLAFVTVLHLEIPLPTSQAARCAPTCSALRSANISVVENVLR